MNTLLYVLTVWVLPIMVIILLIAFLKRLYSAPAAGTPPSSVGKFFGTVAAMAIAIFVFVFMMNYHRSESRVKAWMEENTEALVNKITTTVETNLSERVSQELTKRASKTVEVLDNYAMIYHPKATNTIAELEKHQERFQRIEDAVSTNGADIAGHRKEIDELKARVTSLENRPNASQIQYINRDQPPQVALGNFNQAQAGQLTFSPPPSVQAPNQQIAHGNFPVIVEEEVPAQKKYKLNPIIQEAVDGAASKAASDAVVPINERLERIEQMLNDQTQGGGASTTTTTDVTVVQTSTQQGVRDVPIFRIVDVPDAPGFVDATMKFREGAKSRFPAIPGVDLIGQPIIDAIQNDDRNRLTYTVTLRAPKQVADAWDDLILDLGSSIVQETHRNHWRHFAKGDPNSQQYINDVNDRMGNEAKKVLQARVPGLSITFRSGSAKAQTLAEIYPEVKRGFFGGKKKKDTVVVAQTNQPYAAPLPNPSLYENR